MSLPIESPTPLLLVSELAGRLNIKNATDTNGRVLRIILQASQAFQAACNRRFDEFIETRTYTPFHISQGGDLLGLRELRLDMDLKSTPANTTVTNGDGSVIAAGNMKFLPLNSTYKTTIRLNPYGINFWYHAGVTDPVGSIAIGPGIWGWGGAWLDTGATVSVDSGTSMTVPDGTKLEIGTVIKMDSEYRYVSAIAANTITTTPAFNGSTQVAHNTNTVIYRWQSQSIVQKSITRLIQVTLETDKTPLFGQTVIGDVVFPVTVDAYPKDVLTDVRNTGLKRRQRIQSV